MLEVETEEMTQMKNKMTSIITGDRELAASLNERRRKLE
jgi:hypothetical protein